MALEIKELIVKVRVTEEDSRGSQPDINIEELKNQVIEECLFELEERLTNGPER